MLLQASSDKLLCSAPVNLQVPDVHVGGNGDAGVREPTLLHREQRGGYQLHLHPRGDVVGGADPHIPGLRGLLAG